MRALVLAAGYGTRLKPLTNNLAKPLVTVADKTILQHIIEKLEDIEEIDEIYVVSNNRYYEQIKDYLIRFTFSKRIAVLNDGTNTNEDRLGAVGDIHFAIKEANVDDDLLVINGDNLFGFSMQDFIDFSKKKNASAVALRDLKKAEAVRKKFGVCILEGSKIVDFQEKPEEPKSTLASTGCYFYPKKDLVLIDEYVRTSEAENTGELLKFISEKSEVHGFVFHKHWFDIGNHDNLYAARKVYYAKHIVGDLQKAPNGSH